MVKRVFKACSQWVLSVYSGWLERFSNTQITKILITKQLDQLVFKMILWYFLAYMAKKQYLCSDIQNSHDYEKDFYCNVACDCKRVMEFY